MLRKMIMKLAMIINYDEVNNNNNVDKIIN